MIMVLSLLTYESIDNVTLVLRHTGNGVFCSVSVILVLPRPKLKFELF